jgi:nucleoside-diphosphate-sugar epimerase
MNWSGKRVLLTGHTGFKGSWLSLWLQQKGAELCGIALEPPTKVNLFQDAGVERGMRSVIGDIATRLLKSDVCRASSGDCLSSCSAAIGAHLL